MMKFALFVALSVGIVSISWKSLKNRRSHGFFRFFAFELILILILMNIDYWLERPFAAQQIASWILLTASLSLAIHAFFLFISLGKSGSPDGQSANLRFENTTQLVTTGAYGYIRHPMYCSLLLFAWGAFLKDASVFAAVAALFSSVLLYATARVEERENIQRFGGEYEAYMKKTKMFLPYLF